VRGRTASSEGSVAKEGGGGLWDLLEWPEDILGFQFSSRWIPERKDSSKIHLNLSYQFTDWFRAGLDVRPLVDDVSVQANVRVFQESNDPWRPSLILGTSSREFGDITSRSYSAVLAKHVYTWGEVDFSPYVGAGYIEEIGEVRAVGGLHIRKGNVAIIFQYSGVAEHLTLSYSYGNHALSFLLFDLKMPGVAHTFSF